jgi:hypothetical protein
MSQDTENFESLRRLLALKRYEQPPPGYFRHFSGHVIARIRAGEAEPAHAFLERLFGQAPWLRRLWAACEGQPVLAGAFGVAVCGLLILGVAYPDQTGSAPVALLPTTEALSGPMTLANVSPPNHMFLARPAVIEAVGTNLVTPMPASALLMDDFKNLPVEHAAFTFSGQN